MIDKKCVVCGKKFRVANTRTNAKYCSRDCYKKEHSKEIECDYCGKVFRRAKSGIHKNNYCSMACKSKDPKLKKRISESNKKSNNTGQFKIGHNINDGERRSPRTEFKKGWQKTKKGKKIIKKRIKSIVKKSNKKEKLLMKMIEKAELPYQYVGDGETIVGSKCPDFICNDNQKLIIELYGDYWHNEDNCNYWHQTEKGAKEYYREYGYKTLIIWEKELKKPNNVISKIIDFTFDDIIIESVPYNIYNLFISYAEEEFNGNLAMAIRELVKTVLIDADKFQHVYDILTEHEERIRKLEDNKGKKIKRTISGRKIKIKNEKNKGE